MLYTTSLEEVLMQSGQDGEYNVYRIAFGDTEVYVTTLEDFLDAVGTG